MCGNLRYLNILSSQCINVLVLLLILNGVLAVLIADAGYRLQNMKERRKRYYVKYNIVDINDIYRKSVNTRAEK